MAYYGINAAEQGLIVTMQAVGSLSAAIFIALKGEKYNKINFIAFGILIISVISLFIGGAPVYAALLALIIIFGFGISSVDIMMSGMLADTYPKQKNTLLPVVHGFGAVGAMFTPVFVALTVDPLYPSSFVNSFRFLCAIAGGIFLLYLISSRRIMKETPFVNMEAMRNRAVENPAEIFKTKRAWYLFVVGFLYCTFQYGLTMWLPTFAIRNAGAEFETGALMLTVFFAGSMSMRFLTPLFLRRISASNMYAYFSWAGVAAMLLVLFSQSIPQMFIFIAACGFLQGGNIGLFVLMCCNTFPERTASASSILALSFGIAALTIPYLMGLISEYVGFRIPMVLIIIALFASAAMIFFMRKERAAGLPG